MNKAFLRSGWRWLLSAAVIAPVQAPALHWEPYSPIKVEQAAAAHKVVVVDYSAQWCPSCQDLERLVFSDPVIIHKLSQLVTLRVDATDVEDPKVQKLLDQYNIVGLPTVLFLGDKGAEIDRVEGAASVGQFSRTLDMVAQKEHLTFK